MSISNMGLRHAFGNRWIPAVLLLGALIIAIGGEPLQDALRFDRGAIGEGAIHRLITGHLAHLGWAHLALNAAGLVLVWVLVGGALMLFEWLLVVALTVAAIDIGLWFFLPGLSWYVGLSGVLHGLLAAGAAAGLAHRRTESVVILSLLALKLGYELVAGPMPGSQSAAGGPVVVQAHFFGAAGGLLAVTLIWIRQRRRTSI